MRASGALAGTKSAGEPSTSTGVDRSSSSVARSSASTAASMVVGLDMMDQILPDILQLRWGQRVIVF